MAKEVTTKDGMKCGIFTVVAAVFVVAGIIGIALSTFYWKEENSEEIHGRFGIVFDAGGSGTRMYVYEYKNDEEYVQTFYEKCEEEGLTKYTDNPGTLKPLLSKCLDDAVKKIPSSETSRTPLFMKATAGMRKLKLQNETKYNNIWNTVRNILSNGSFPVKIATTMPGSKEAEYSWTTINELLGQQKSKGLLELGSTSLQIAFEPESTNNLPANYSEDVSINNRNYKIYVHSYLCMGRNELGRRYLAKLAMDKFNNSRIILNPCGYKGYSINKTKSYLIEAPCVNGQYAKNTFGKSIDVNISGIGSSETLEFVGTGNFAECKAQVESMFFNNCSHSSCGTIGVFQPQAHGQYLGIGGGAYYAADFLKLPNGYSENEFQTKTEELCVTTFDQVQQRSGYSKYATDYCLSNVYTNFILQNILKLNRTEKGLISFVDKINDNKISWTLGSIIDDKNDMSPTLMKITKDLESTEFYVVVTLSALLVVMGILLLVTCFCCFGKRGSVTTNSNKAV